MLMANVGIASSVSTQRVTIDHAQTRSDVIADSNYIISGCPFSQRTFIVLATMI